MRFSGSAGVLAVLMAFSAAAPAVAGPNLLSNGGFESGGGGWRDWRGDWSTGYARSFFDTSPGHSGNYCLNLVATSASFGVYQTVLVTPGRYYRLECRWKGTFTSTENNWAEIELLQGPFDLVQADQRPEDLVHKVYSYDAPPDAPPVTFDWVWTPALDGSPVDPNGYRGIRQAVTNRLTVVLKAGAIGGPTTHVWFDDLALYEVGPTSGDFDIDGDVDLPDFGHFQACFNGPNRLPAQSGCADADFDHDSDVDLADFAMFQACFNGPNRPPACD
jgi:hypothetical protein